jgi:hypothetical protein
MTDFNEKLDKWIKEFLDKEAPEIEQLLKDAAPFGWGVRVTRWVETDEKGTRLCSEADVDKNVPAGKVEDVWK